MTQGRRIPRLTEQQRLRYAELLESSDPDALQDLIVRRGPEILDRDLPYIVVAVRNQLRSRMRRGAHQHEIPSAEADLVGRDEPRSLWDPLEQVIAHEALSELVAALAELDPRDLLVVWNHASGRSDAEIAALWNELGFDPPHPSLDSIRKRRERVRTRLRQQMRLEHGS